MKKSRFIDSQIVAILKQAENGVPVPDEHKLSNDNVLIAHLLLDLSQRQRNWGFGLCFLYLRNVKGYVWNHKRVYRIYQELELHLRIKPKNAFHA